MKFTIARRIVQLAVLGLFIAGNIYGLKILEGNLSSSLLFGKIGLSDPFAVLQAALAGLGVGSASVVGALIVLVFYALIAPRAYCSWVCPVNILTDTGAYLREKLGVKKSLLSLSRNSRYYLLVLTLVASGLFGILAFESVNYVGVFTRSVLALSWSAVTIAAVIIIFEIFAGNRILCSHLCPLGGFYAVASKFSLIRVHHDASKCTKCGKCKLVCPEVQVLDMVGKQNGKVSSECVSCGRCVEACEDDALNFSILGERK